MIFAVTGATGFVGGAFVEEMLRGGHEVRALTRRPQPPRERLTWVEGTLADPAALDDLVSGADAVIHVAGVVNAPDRAGFAAGNIDGTRAMLAVAQRAGVKKFVQISSLAAREPRLSDYGWSKAEAEKLVAASDFDWTIVRPTGVYGPGDTELRDLFRMAKWGFALLPPPGLVSLVHVDDLASMLRAVATSKTPRETYEVDDGFSYTHEALGRMIGQAVGRRVLPVHLPRALLSVGARLDGWLRRGGAKLTPDRVGYLAHPDWAAARDRRPPRDLWSPRIDTPDGLAATAAWYRAHGLL